MRPSTNKSRINELEARYIFASEHVERLTPSLLAKAFRGELVGQDVHDEPVSALVERVKKGRETTGDAVRKDKSRVKKRDENVTKKSKRT